MSKNHKEKERLVDLIMSCNTYTPDYELTVRLTAEHLANRILEDGWIRIPLAVNDNVYVIFTDKVYEGKITFIGNYQVRIKLLQTNVTITYQADDYGTEFFRSKTEATEKWTKRMLDCSDLKKAVEILESIKKG